MIRKEVEAQFNTKEKVELLREYLADLTMEASFDDHVEFIQDVIMNGYDGYADTSFDDLITELMENNEDSEEDLLEAIDDALTGSR